MAALLGKTSGLFGLFDQLAEYIVYYSSRHIWELPFLIVLFTGKRMALWAIWLMESPLILTCV